MGAAKESWVPHDTGDHASSLATDPLNLFSFCRLESRLGKVEISIAYSILSVVDLRPMSIFLGLCCIGLCFFGLLLLALGTWAGHTLLVEEEPEPEKFEHFFTFGCYGLGAMGIGLAGLSHLVGLSSSFVNAVVLFLITLPALLFIVVGMMKLRDAKDYDGKGEGLIFMLFGTIAILLSGLCVQFNLSLVLRQAGF